MPPPSRELVFILPEAGTEIRTQYYRDIASASAHVRLQGSLQAQIADGSNKPIVLVLPEITELEMPAFCMALTWASYPSSETFSTFLPDIAESSNEVSSMGVDSGANESESLICRLVEYFWSLLELYKIAEKLAMKNLQRQILDLFNTDALHRYPVSPTEFPKGFLTSPRAPSYGMLGMYFYRWLDIVHREELQGLSLEDAEPLLDAMELLRQNLQVDLARAKLQHKKDIKGLAKTWRINPIDDLPHRFTVFPGHEPTRKAKVPQGRRKSRRGYGIRKILDEETTKALARDHAKAEILDDISF